MRAIKLETRNEQVFVSSRIVAERLELSHDSLVRTISRHETAIQGHFGVIGFEVQKPIGSKTGGRPTKTYYLTENQALFITTLSRNTEAVVNLKADLVQAFSDARKPKALSLADQLLLSAQLLVNHEDRIKMLEAKTTTRPRCFSVAGFASLNGVKLNLQQSASLGRKAAAYCRANGLIIERTHDVRFGEVNVYPEIALKSAFKPV